MSQFLKIGGYSVIRPLGAGGMGTVYLAEDDVLRRKVALKVVSGALSDDEAARARFLREARSLAAVEHPNVVRVYSFGESEGTTYMAMEYVEGESLADLLHRTGPLPVDEALEIAGQVVLALEAAWEHGIVHRDVKPGNILIDPKRQVRVADFGLAKPAHGTEPSVTQGSTVLGTPQYLSPEQARGGAVDFRTDVYSLGIVVYQLLTGTCPFEGTAPLVVIGKHLHEPLPSLRVVRPDLPIGVDELVRWMTQKDPRARPSSYRELWQRIAALRDDSVATLPTVESGAAPAGRAIRHGVAVASLVAVILGGLFLWRRPTPSPAPTQPKLVVALVPFHAVNEEAVREARVMTALVERAINERLGEEDVKVLGSEGIGEAVRSHDAARTLGDRVGAGVVIWGQILSLGRTTEVQPFVTLTRPAASPVVSARVDPLAARLHLSGPQLLVLDPRSGDDTERRKTTARDIGDTVLFLAGLHSLQVRHNAGKALTLFERLSRTPVSLRYRARALLELKRRDEAMAWAREAAVLDPDDRDSRALVGQLHAEAGRLKEAIVEYRRALPPPDAFVSDLGFFDGGRLYVKEVRIGYLDPRLTGSSVPSETGYLLAIDAGSGTVRERYRLPGLITGFAREGERVLITVRGFSGDRRTTLAFSHGRFETPLHYGSSMILRRQLDQAARSFASGLMEAVLGGRQALAIRQLGTPPRTIAELEVSLQQIVQTDPTQPWHRFHLGVAQRALGRRGDAVATFAALFEGAPVGLPYYEFAGLAHAFEKLGEREWADRAWKEAVARRRRLAQPVGFASLLELLTNAPFVASAGEASINRADPERLHLWLARGRELMGVTWEAEDFAAAAWERYYRTRGAAEKARRETERFRHVRARPLNVTSMFARLEYLLRGWAAATSAWVAFLALALTAAGGPIRARLAAVPPHSRGVALAAAALSAAFGVASVDAGGHMGALLEVPLGTADSMASLAEEFEARARQTGAAEAAYAAAVAHHTAGHAARATDLYREVPDHEGVRQNRSALARGQLVPPRPLNDEDLLLAYVRGSLVSRLRNWLDVVQELGPAGWLLAAAGPGVVVVMTLGSILALAFWQVPTISFPVPVRANGRRRLLHLLMPGAFDVRYGAPTRGYACLLGLAFSVWILLGIDPASPAPGPLLRSVPVGWGVVPFPPASSSDIEALEREHYWTVFWAYPHAHLLWTLVGLGAAGVLVRHIWEVRHLTRKAGDMRVAIDTRRSENPRTY